MGNRVSKTCGIIANLLAKLSIVIILSIFISSCSTSKLSSVPEVPDWAKPTNAINKIKGIFTKEEDKDK